jgi:flagellar protein FlaG
MRTDHVENLSQQQNFNRANSRINSSSNNSSQNKPDSLQEKASRTSSNQKNLEEDVNESVKNMNEIVEQVKEDLSFKVHKKTGKLMVQIVDLKTKEVIKEMPPEEMLDLEAKIHEMVGLLIDEKV